MSDEEINIAICRATGWAEIAAEKVQWDGITIRDRRFNGYGRKLLRWNQTLWGSGWGESPGRHTVEIGDETTSYTTVELLEQYELPTFWTKNGKVVRTLPNHIDGIEALGYLHEAEKLLTPAQIQAYRGRLADACPYKSDDVLGWWAVTHSNSRERAVGLAKVWGLYKDTL